MHKTKIVNLGSIRDALAQLELVRQHLLSGKVTGFYATFQDNDQREVVYVAGTYKDNQQAALRGALRVSAIRTRVEDTPPKFRRP